MRRRLAEGKAEGLAEGETKAKLNLALTMKAANIPISIIIEMTGFTAEELG